MDRLTFSSVNAKGPHQIRREMEERQRAARHTEAALRVTTRERGTIPGCRPAGHDSHMAVDKQGRPYIEVAKVPSTIDAWLAEGRAALLASRKTRGACLDCGYQPKPKHPQTGKRYCQCKTGKFEAVAA